MEVMAVAMVVMVMVVEIIVYGGGKVMVKTVAAMLVVMTTRGRMEYLPRLGMEVMPMVVVVMMAMMMVEEEKNVNYPFLLNFYIEVIHIISDGANGKKYVMDSMRP